MFQHTATRRWLRPKTTGSQNRKTFQHTATRRWLPIVFFFKHILFIVSTHSHPKVAAKFAKNSIPFNGVSTHSHPKVAALNLGLSLTHHQFQHTATRRWLRRRGFLLLSLGRVSTHSHPKVAAVVCISIILGFCVSTHSHPKVAAGIFYQIVNGFDVSTHSHPKVAARKCSRWRLRGKSVSTHSHPKVAATFAQSFEQCLSGFNTQPPEGGCDCGVYL